jgi:hypothetical protein
VREVRGASALSGTGICPGNDGEGCVEEPELKRKDLTVRGVVQMATGIRPGFPVAGDGYQAEVQAKKEHLRLFAELYSLGYLAVVYDVNRKNRVSREDANDLDDAKAKAESMAAGYLRYRRSRTVTASRVGPESTE